MFCPGVVWFVVVCWFFLWNNVVLWSVLVCGVRFWFGLGFCGGVCSNFSRCGLRYFVLVGRIFCLRSVYGLVFVHVCPGLFGLVVLESSGFGFVASCLGMLAFVVVCTCLFGMCVLSRFVVGWSVFSAFSDWSCIVWFSSGLLWFVRVCFGVSWFFVV